MEILLFLAEAQGQKSSSSPNGLYPSGLDPGMNEEFLKYGCKAVGIFLTSTKSLFLILKVES